MNPILEQISNIGLVPVIKIDDAEKAVPLVRALKKGGIPVAEVTFRTACAAEAIRKIADAEPDVLVGAGTIISVEQAKAAVEAGAKYIISPGFDAEVVKWCIDNNVPITPGCSDASDVSVAAKMGLEVVKFFPAEAAGGLKVLKALSGPFPNMKFIPTGGIGPDNLGSYLAFKKIIACGGSWMVPGDMLDNNDWDGITALAREAILKMLDIKLRHIGINSASEEEAVCTAERFSAMTGGAVKDGNDDVRTDQESHSASDTSDGTHDGTADHAHCQADQKERHGDGLTEITGGPGCEHVVQALESRTANFRTGSHRNAGDSHHRESETNFFQHEEVLLKKTIDQ